MEDIRFVENPFFKVFNLIHADSTKLYSLLLNLLQEYFKEVRLPTLENISSIPANSEVDISAYSGTSGYIYMLIRTYWYFQKREQKMYDFVVKSNIGDTLMNQLMDPAWYLQLALSQFQTVEKFILSQKPEYKCFSFYMSEVCTWVCGMHLGYQKRDQSMFRKCESRILRCFETVKENRARMQWQLLYGVPGFLYAVLELQMHYDSKDELFRTHFGTVVKELTHMVIQEGVRRYQQSSKTKVDPFKLPEGFRLTYDFHKKEYIGGAHGLAGNLNIILIAMRKIDFGGDVPAMMKLIEASIRFLLRHFINGNFTTSSGSQKVKLMHFCHGAPGVVSCLARFADIFPQSAIQMGLKEVIEVALNSIWKFGVLKKGFGLCHGISGNAYAFLNPAIQVLFPQRVQQFRKKAELFAILRQEKDVMKEIKGYVFEDRDVVGISDHPYSLMLGISGDICFVIDALQGVGYFPGFDLK